MYAQGMEQDILYAWQVNKPMTFQELAKRSYDIEVTLAHYRGQLSDDGSTILSINRNSMLKVSQENEFSYSESYAPEMLDKLLQKGLIKLLESQCPEEIERTNDSKYCKYHRIISHPIKKCDAFKRQVLQLAKEGKIMLDEEDVEYST